MHSKERQIFLFISFPLWCLSKNILLSTCFYKDRRKYSNLRCGRFFCVYLANLKRKKMNISYIPVQQSAQQRNEEGQETDPKPVVSILREHIQSFYRVFAMIIILIIGIGIGIALVTIGTILSKTCPTARNDSTSISVFGAMMIGVCVGAGKVVCLFHFLMFFWQRIFFPSLLVLLYMITVNIQILFALAFSYYHLCLFYIV